MASEIYVKDEAYTDGHGIAHRSFLRVNPNEAVPGTAQVFMWSTEACMSNYLNLDADELEALATRCMEVAKGLRSGRLASCGGPPGCEGGEPGCRTNHYPG